jgi:hypothetical protein
MSYGIVRVQKFKAGGVTGIQIHDLREKDKSHTNKSIDWTKTDTNYDLAPENNLTFNKRIKEKIDRLNLKRAVRKDAVKMIQCLVTSDREFFDKSSPEETKQFFEDSYEFLKEKYGEENIVSSIVHMDEKTPHMHFNFVPITEDGRLSGKEVVSRGKIKYLHDTFIRDVGQKYGLERGKERNPTEPPKHHLSPEEYKKQTLREIEGLEQKLQDAKKAYQYYGDAEGVEIKTNPITKSATLKGTSPEKMKEALTQMPILAQENAQLLKSLESLQADSNYYEKAYKSLFKRHEKLKDKTSVLESKIGSITKDNRFFKHYIGKLDQKPNIEGIERLEEYFKSSETWLDLDNHIQKIGSKPLSRRNILQYLDSSVDGLIKINIEKLGEFSEVDILVIKDKALNSIGEMLKASPDYVFDADSNTYSFDTEESMDQEIVRPAVEAQEL